MIDIDVKGGVLTVLGNSWRVRSYAIGFGVWNLCQAATSHSGCRVFNHWPWGGVMDTETFQQTTQG